jgi:Spherulation-specific family 4
MAHIYRAISPLMFPIHRNRKFKIVAGLLAVCCAVLSLLWLTEALVPSGPGPVQGEHLDQQLNQQLAVPSYANPSTSQGTWEQLTNSTSGRVGFAVANVYNGPTDHEVSAWTSAIRQAHERGIKVVGYVDTGYLGEPTVGHPDGLVTRAGLTGLAAWTAQAQADVASWYQHYGSDLAGVFFDQVPDRCGSSASPTLYANSYSTLSNEVKQAHPGALTVLNPGTAVPRCFEESADVLVTFEGSYAAYVGATSSQDGYRPLSWLPLDPQKICHLVYGAPSLAEMQQVMEVSKSRHAGYVYVTDDASQNPYQALPSQAYWSVEQTSSFPYGNPGGTPRSGST